MSKSLFLLFLLVPFLVFAYTSVVTYPESAFEIIPILSPQDSQEFFGELRSFPHTYEFVVKEQFDFSARISIPDELVQENLISIILVKEERRGVSEVGRTHNEEIVWVSKRDDILAETFLAGGAISASISPGVYRLEVSSPDNSGKYRLSLGDGKVRYSYFENIRRVMEVKSFLGKSKFSIVFSPLVYRSLLVLAVVMLGFWFYKKRRKQKHA